MSIEVSKQKTDSNKINLEQMKKLCEEKGKILIKPYGYKKKETKKNVKVSAHCMSIPPVKRELFKIWNKKVRSLAYPCNIMNKASSKKYDEETLVKYCRNAASYIRQSEAGRVAISKINLLSKKVHDGAMNKKEAIKEFKKYLYDRSEGYEKSGLSKSKIERLPRIDKKRSIILMKAKNDKKVKNDLGYSIKIENLESQKKWKKLDINKIIKEEFKK